MYIHTSTIPTHSTFIKCPPYSKILHFHIRNGQYHITFQSESYVGYSPESDWKTFNILILNGIMLNNSSVPNTHEYFTTIRYQDDDFVEYYHIFLEEIKSLSEQRDSKIGEIMDQEF